MNFDHIIVHFHWIQALEVFSMTKRIFAATSAICFKFF